MRLLLLTLVLGAFSALTIQGQKPPQKVTFESKMGTVTYDHAKHLAREKGDCKVCHPKLFPQSKASIDFKAGPMHQPAEKAKTSCGACHVEGGSAFAVKGNCAKCHVKGA